MSEWDLAWSAAAATALFLYGLSALSRELQEVGGETLRARLRTLTANRLRGFALGAVATAVVQSSSAVTSLTVALVDTGAIGFSASLPVLLGANLGTTVTAWLVSLKLTLLGRILMVAGAILSAVPVRARIVGKAIFYLGLVLFAIDLLSIELRPLSSLPTVVRLLELANSPWLGLLIGAALTGIIQSSSVTTGLAIVLVQGNLLPPEAAIPMVLGSNVGSTTTALIASLSGGSTARATAKANLFFNVLGVLVFCPLLVPFSRSMVQLIPHPAMAVASAHLVFNLTMAAMFLPTLRWFEPYLQPAVDQLAASIRDAPLQE